MQARVEGRVVVLGNRRLMDELAIRLDALEQRAAEPVKANAFAGPLISMEGLVT